MADPHGLIIGEVDGQARARETTTPGKAAPPRGLDAHRDLSYYIKGEQMLIRRV